MPPRAPVPAKTSRSKPGSGAGHQTLPGNPGIPFLTPGPPALAPRRNRPTGLPRTGPPNRQPNLNHLPPARPLPPPSQGDYLKEELSLLWNRLRASR